MEYKWYVLRAAQPLKAVQRMKELKAKENGWPSAFKELRAPIRYVAPKNRAQMKQEHPMVFNYIFALARLEELSSFLADNPDLKTWVLSRQWKDNGNGGFQLAASSVPSAEIDQFFRVCDAIAKVESNYVPFVEVKSEEFQVGDLVRVKNGVFGGQTGYLVDQKASTVVLKLMDGLGAPVQMRGVELERVNVSGVKNAKFELFDRFFEHIDSILERWMANQHTSDDLAFVMQAYNDSQTLDDLSPKLRSKQLTLQLICQTIMGNRKQAQELLIKCSAFLPRVKDKNQRAQHSVYTYVCKPLPEHHDSACQCLEGLSEKKRNEYEKIIKLIK